MSRIAHTGLASSYDPAEEAEKLEERKRQESGPVKQTLALDEFVTFSSQEKSGRGSKVVTITARGEVLISRALILPLETRVELLLNRRGNILVMRESPKGIPFKMQRGCCTALKNALVSAGAELPVKFVMEWDEELGAWVGRR